MEPPFWKVSNNLSPLTVPLICSVYSLPPSLLLPVLFPMLCSRRCDPKSHVLSLSNTALNSEGRDSDWLSLGQVSPVGQSAVRWTVCMLLWKHGCSNHSGKGRRKSFQKIGVGWWLWVGGGGCQSSTQINQAVMHREVPTPNLLWFWRHFPSKR